MPLDSGGEDSPAADTIYYALYRSGPDTVGDVAWVRALPKIRTFVIVRLHSARPDDTVRRAGQNLCCAII